MSVFGWIALGLIAGFIASKIVNKAGESLAMDFVLGIVGALIGGWLFSIIGEAGITGFNVTSMFVSVVGASAVLLAYHAMREV